MAKISKWRNFHIFVEINEYDVAVNLWICYLRRTSFMMENDSPDYLNRDTKVVHEWCQHLKYLVLSNLRGYKS